MKHVRQASRPILHIFTVSNIVAVLLILNGIAILSRPDVGVPGFLNNVYHFSPMKYSLIFAIAGAYLIDRKPSDRQMILCTLPLTIHTALVWYYSIVFSESSLSPAIWYTALCALVLYSVMKDESHAKRDA